MPALNFQERFAADVERGLKTQTIRAIRKRPIKVGDTLYLYTGLRRPGARLLRTEQCTEAFPIKLRKTRKRPVITVAGDNIWWNSQEAAYLARRDGFATIRDLLEWFEKTHGFPFLGQVIRWR